MLHHQRECGLITPNDFIQQQISKRIDTLELCKLKEFENVATSIINDIDLDLAEGRYLLAGQSDGSILVFDTEASPLTEGSRVSTNKCVLTIARRRQDISHGGGGMRRPVSQIPATPPIREPRQIRDDPDFLVPPEERPPVSIPAAPTPGQQEGTAGPDVPGARDGHSFSVRCVQWYPVDSGMFVSSGTDKIVKIWDTNAAKCIDEYPFPGMVYAHHQSTLASRNNLIAVATSAGQTVLVDLVSGSSVHTLTGHRASVNTVRWSPREDFSLATGGEDGKGLIWDIRSAKGAKIHLDQYSEDTADANPSSAHSAHCGPVQSLEFTPDGLTLASYGQDLRLRLWNPLTGAASSVNFGPLPNQLVGTFRFALVQSSSMRGHGWVVMPSGADIKLLDLQSGDTRTTLLGHYNQVNCCLFNHNLHEIYSSGLDRNLLLWASLTDAPVASGQPLPVEEGVPGFYRRVGAGGTEDHWSDDDETVE